MSKPTFDANSEAYMQYAWIVSIIEPYTDGLSIDTTDEDSEDDIESTTTITLTKKVSGKSFVTMKTEDQEITINWDGNRLSATIFNEETQDSDKLEVPEAITSIVDALKDLFGISQEIVVEEESIIPNDEDEDIDDDLSKDPEDDKPENNIDDDGDDGDIDESDTRSIG